MKEMKLVVEADCQISKLYNFTLDPANTPLWIDGIVHEERNESPTRVGIITTGMIVAQIIIYRKK